MSFLLAYSGIYFLSIIDKLGMFYVGWLYIVNI